MFLFLLQMSVCTLQVPKKIDELFLMMEVEKELTQFLRCNFWNE